MEWGLFWSAITGAVVGGLITGFFSIWATKKSYDNQRAHSKENEEKTIYGLLSAIHDEIETVFDRYQETMGIKLESLNKNAALLIYYPLVSNYFPVYDDNCSLIGRISDNEIRRQIIKTYTLSKGLIDSFRLNNDLIAKYEYSEKLYDESKLDIHKKKTMTHYSALVDYAKALKDLHIDFKKEVDNLLRALK